MNDEYMQLKKDRLNGEAIYRGVVEKGGVNIQTSTVVFPPKMYQGAPPVINIDEQTEQFMARLVTISNQIGDPVLKAQVLAFRHRLKRSARAALYRSALIERERLKQALAHQRMPLAVAVIEGTPING